MSPSTETTSRPRASVLGSIAQGWSRVLQAPWLGAGALGVSLLIAALRAVTASYGTNALEFRTAPMGWADNISEATVEIGRMFAFELNEFAHTIALAARFVSGESLRPGLSAYVVVTAGLWIFLAGGILDRLARGRRVGAGAFFGACGAHAGRFLRLALIVGPLYWALFTWVYPYPALLAAICVVDVVTDFTRIRAVVEDRRSILSAIAAALRFIRRRPFRVAVLYLANIAILVALAAVWTVVTRIVVVPGIAIASIYVLMLVRAWAFLAFTGSEIAFFQGELAHAHYTAGPVKTWPDSPAVEAIQNLARVARSGASAPIRRADQ